MLIFLQSSGRRILEINICLILWTFSLVIRILLKLGYQKISALWKFHLCNKSLKFVTFTCIKIESKFFRGVFKAFFNMNPSFLSVYSKFIPWGSDFSLAPGNCVLLCISSSSVLCSEWPFLPFPLKCMPVITRRSQRLPPLKCHDRSSHWKFSFPSTLYLSC